MEIIEIKRVGELPKRRRWVMPGSALVYKWQVAEELGPEKIYHLRWWWKRKDELKVANWWFVDVEELNGKHERGRTVEGIVHGGAGVPAGDGLAMAEPPVG